MVNSANAMFRSLCDRLSQGGIEDSELEARFMLESLFGESAYTKLLTDRLEIDSEKEKTLEEYVSRRISGEPLQYILGEWEFFGLNFKVGKGVLIPRQDTETLVETALRLMKNIDSPKILDLCSGTGCIPITLCLKKPDAVAAAVELYDEAYGYLTRNISLHSANVKPIKADVLSIDTASKFSALDIITANPPYLTKEDMDSLQREVKFEPAAALYGDIDGLHFYREISRLYKPSLKDGGYIVFEIGITQADDVSEILIINGYKNVRVISDLTHRPRVVIGQK